MKFTHYLCGLAVLAVGVVGLFQLICWWQLPVNPWKRFGVTSDWQGYGNTGLVEAVYSVDFRGRTITGYACPGATYDFDLSAEDVDHDGIPEVVLKIRNSPARVVLAFRPARGDKPPEFVTLECSVGS